VAITGTADGIDQIFVVYHQFSTGRVANLGPARARVLRNWQRAVDYVVPLRNWHWRYDNVAIVGGPGAHDTLTLPAVWGNEGRDGVLWNTTTQTPLGWISLRDMEQMRQRYANLDSGTPRHYSVRGKEIRLFPRAGDTMNYVAQYERKKPALEDTNGMTAESYDNGGLEMIPEQWWDTVLYEWAAWLEMKYIGNITEAAVQKTLIEDMVFNMTIEEAQGKPTPDYMPRFPGSASVWEVE
jgi:hypothetical protein